MSFSAEKAPLISPASRGPRNAAGTFFVARFLASGEP